MKKVLYFVLFFLPAVALTSCEEELELWDSTAVEYAGRYVVELQSEDQSDTYHDYAYGMEIDLYNTASDTKNEIWFEDLHGDIPLKVKLFLDGSPTSFKSKSLKFEDLDANMTNLEFPGNAPTSLGQIVTEDAEYLKGGIIEGKILEKAASTIGGNSADSIYIKISLKSGSATFTSIETPEDGWVDHLVPEYEWEFTSMAYDDTRDEIYVISGHRYTGFPEDRY